MEEGYMQSPPQTTPPKPSSPTTSRSPKIHLKPALGGIALIVIGAQQLAPTLEQWRRWDALQTQGQQAAGKVLSTQAAIASSSRKISSYQVSYEFAAPKPGSPSSAQSGVTPSTAQPSSSDALTTEPTTQAEPPGTTQIEGSTASAAEVQAMLQDQFWNPTLNGSSEGSAASASQEQPPANLQANVPALPQGQRFFRGRQTLSKEDYQQLGLGLGLTSAPIDVIYDPQQPSNSAISQTGSYPTGKLAFLALFIIGGLGLSALGLSPLRAKS